MSGIMNDCFMDWLEIYYTYNIVPRDRMAHSVAAVTYRVRAKLKKLHENPIKHSQTKVHVTLFHDSGEYIF